MPAEAPVISAVPFVSVVLIFRLPTTRLGIIEKSVGACFTRREQKQQRDYCNDL
jgi:hypothetical protein